MAVWLWNFWIFSFWGWCLERLFAAVTHSPRQRRRCLLVPPLLTWLCLMVFAADAVCSLRFLAVTHDLNALRYAF